MRGRPGGYGEENGHSLNPSYCRSSDRERQKFIELHDDTPKDLKINLRSKLIAMTASGPSGETHSVTKKKGTAFSISLH